MGSFAYLCGSKKTYESKREAKEAVRRANTQRGAQTSAYRCPWGDHYHIGRQDGRER